MRGSIRLVKRVPTNRICPKVVIGKPQILEISVKNFTIGRKSATIMNNNIFIEFSYSSPTSHDKINLILNMVCPGGELRPPHPHFQSAASAASGNGFIFENWFKTRFFKHGLHIENGEVIGRYGEIQVVAMRICFIQSISQKNRFSGPWTFPLFSVSFLHV